MYQCRCNKEFISKTSLTGHQGRCAIHKEWINDILTPEFLFKEHVINKKSTPEISAEVNICIATIHRRLRALGISRTIKESCQIESKTQKSIKTCLEKSGFPHNFCKNHPNRVKWEKRLKETEGIINVFQRESVKAKIKQTILSKYGVESAGQITTFRGKNSYSKLHKEVVQEFINIGMDIKIEKKMPKPNGMYWSFDIYIEPNILIEVNGDYWHGNPEIYCASDIILKGSSSEVLVSAKWEADRQKIKAAEDLGYKVIITWEHDWKCDKYIEFTRICNEIANSKDRRDRDK